MNKGNLFIQTSKNQELKALSKTEKMEENSLGLQQHNNVNFDDSFRLQLTKQDLEILKFKYDFNKSKILRDWIKKFPNKAKLYRGKNNETLLHWAAITNINLIKDLVNYIKLDVNEEDKYGSTPFDWLIERYFSNVVLNNNNLDQNSRYFMQYQTLEHSKYFYDVKAFTHYDVIDIFSKSGLFDFIDYIYKKEGLESLINLTETQKSVLHNWILVGESELKHKKIQDLLNYGIDIDIEDKDGNTPLFYAIDALISKPELKDFLLPSIKTLLKENANPYHKNKDGLSPYHLFNKTDKIENELFEIFNDMIKENQETKENNK